MALVEREYLSIVVGMGCAECEMYRLLRRATLKLKHDTGIFMPVVWLLGVYVLAAIVLFFLRLINVF